MGAHMGPIWVQYRLLAGMWNKEQNLLAKELIHVSSDLFMQTF